MSAEKILFSSGNYSEYLKRLNTPQRHRRVLAATMGQKNKAWCREKCFMIGGSNAGYLSRRPTAEAFLKRVAAGVVRGARQPQALSYGTLTETLAQRAYYNHFAAQHTSPSYFCNPGIIIDPQYGFLGASVDMLVYCTSCGLEKICEFKCPWRAVRDDISDLRSLKLEYLTGPDLVLKPKSDNYLQCQFYMGVTGLHNLDFVVYTPPNQLHIQKVEFCSEKFLEMRANIVQNYGRVMRECFFDEP